ncbi:hypothetical protein PQR57_05860 [Paraburkholderia dipogonis]|uniref:Uncharacterized protein n=1 Tax=Paraburkholderia dipogonis TaxID=1211383 RepID=A0ABW9AKT5_9BURK
MQAVYLFSGRMHIYIEGMYQRAIHGGLGRTAGGHAESSPSSHRLATRRLKRFRTDKPTPCENKAPLVEMTDIVMDHPGTALTSPIISRDAAMWFSAYGFGW